jgi:putative glutamine amidotransferase
MAQRPIIGVTGPDKGGLIAWLMTALALTRCGAKAVRLTPSRAGRFGRIEDIALDALVIGGGTDVDPFHYGQQSDGQESEPAEDRDSIHRRTPLDWLVGLVLGVFRALFATHSVQDYDPERDQLEKSLIQHALYQQLPTLGICRGAQLMNVVLGGSLHQDIGHFYTEETSNIRSILPRKTIAITQGCHLQEIIGTQSCFVNALHNQSIDRLGEDILVSAVEPSGVIQAIEKHDQRFFIGVQWHPEYMPQSNRQQGLFRGLARCARERAR